MLSALHIRNLVLIDDVAVTFDGGFCALTGETGAGKSIILGAVDLVTGGRAESRMVRKGQDSATVTATFQLDRKHDAALLALLAEQGFIIEDGLLIIRRSIGTDGKSKAFINDTPATATMLKSMAEYLVEIHGQFDTHGLLDAKTHIIALDDYAGFETDDLRAAYVRLHAAEKEHRRLIDAAKTSADDEAYYRHAIDELTKLGPQAGEIDELSTVRQKLMAREKLIEALSEARGALEDGDSVDERIDTAINTLSRVADKAQDGFEAALVKLDQLRDIASDALAEIERALDSYRDIEHDADSVEERLFALKDAARKYRCQPDDLLTVLEDFTARINAIDNFEAARDAAEKELKAARTGYITAAKAVHDLRMASAAKLDKAVMKELKPLKLEKAVFRTDITFDETLVTPRGADRVQFMVTTNPGSPEGAIHKIASGGELARFMLALKVTLAERAAKGDAPRTGTLIFDEVDTGVGGAVADAIGERLARLGTDFRVLAVTHSPQVAARANQHFKVAKFADKTSTHTTVEHLTGAARLEEIARMLAGATVTDESRLAAQKLLGQDHHAAA